MYELLYNEDGMYIHTQFGDFTTNQYSIIGGQCLQYGRLNKHHMQKLIKEVGPDIFRWMFKEGAMKCEYKVFFRRTNIGNRIHNEINEPRLILERLIKWN